MNLFLVHHAPALEPHVDASQPLSTPGRRHAERLASAAAARAMKPSAIWHSGKLRARQTAEVLLLACNPFASFKMMRGLGPADSPDFMADLLRHEDADTMVVGHLPSLSLIASRLLRQPTDMPLHGLLWLAKTDAEVVIRERLVPSQDDPAAP